MARALLYSSVPKSAARRSSMLANRRRPAERRHDTACGRAVVVSQAAVLVDEVHGQRQGYAVQHDVVVRPVGRGGPGPRGGASPHLDLAPPVLDEHVLAEGGD